MLAVGAIPAYITGNWSFANPPTITTFKSLRSIKTDGLRVSGWEIESHQEAKFSGHQWLVQTLQTGDRSAILLALPQNGPKDKPQVEWMDINGLYRWKTDSYQHKKFLVETSGKEVTVEARFFRGWSDRQTYAIVQWYAWPSGGSPAPSSWFWTDRFAMLSQKRRVPWVAVSIQIPIEPLGEIEAYWPVLESLAQKVQLSLIEQAFADTTDN
ncbi:MAG: cyanoexosortase B system-associated protein [Okeania sp. SIO2H7]|nr:cyanoexosortase B system-associated protein [Okeania sp. SIO2H7]